MQTAAVICIQNLIWKDEEGTLERQAKLKEIGYVISLIVLSLNLSCPSGQLLGLKAKEVHEIFCTAFSCLTLRLS